MVPDILPAAGVAVGILGAAYGTWRRFRPSVRRATAAIDALVGKEAVTDRSGKEIEPAQPGLVHRTTTLEQAVATLVNQDERIKHLENDHGARLKALEDARVERLVNQAESAHMWRAVADNAVNDID